MNPLYLVFGSITALLNRYFNGVLQDTDAGVSKVELLPNGTWKPVEADERPQRAVKELHSVAPGDDDEVQIIGDTDSRERANVSEKLLSYIVTSEHSFMPRTHIFPVFSGR